MKDRMSSLKQEQPLKRKLIGYMLLLAVIIVCVIASIMFIFGRNVSAEEYYSDILSLQLEVFNSSVNDCFEEATVMGIELSKEVTNFLENYMSEKGLSFHDMNDSAENIYNIQDVILENTAYMLQQSDSSGAFVLLDITINSKIEGSENSRSGIYIQKAGNDLKNKKLLLYRGIAEIGEKHEIMVHRKWTQEFKTDIFPNYTELVNNAALPLLEAYRLTDIAYIPGTDEKSVLMTLPIIGTDGEFYGICGFEISQSFFKTRYAQPANINHMICTVTNAGDTELYFDEGLYCGLRNGYYYAPKGIAAIKPMGRGLVELSTENDAYVAKIKRVHLSYSDGMQSIAVMIPKSDYIDLYIDNMIQIIILVFLFMFLSIVCCLLFFKKFLLPISDSLEELKEEHSSIKNDYMTAKVQLERISKNQKKEIDHEKYEYFKKMIKTLSPAEKRIFDYYCQGLGVKDIVKNQDIKEATVRFHNQNIYVKLGVDSLKELLLFISIMQQEK